MKETLLGMDTGFSLKQVTCPKPCANGASCKYNSDVEEYFCDCPLEIDESGYTKEGYVGPTCGTKFVDCHDSESESRWRCYNDAVCGHKMNCNCDPDGVATGQFCEVLPDGYQETLSEDLNIVVQKPVFRRDYFVLITVLVVVSVIFSIIVKKRIIGLSAKLKVSDENEFSPVSLPTADGEDPNLKNTDGAYLEIANSGLEEEIGPVNDLLDYKKGSTGIESTDLQPSVGEFT